MDGPGVLFARGEHHDVTGRATGVEQQVHGLLGGVERAARRGGDQLELRCGMVLRPVAPGGAGRRGRGGYGILALRRGRGPCGAGTRMSGTRRGRGTRSGYGAGGSARCGRRPV
ncbi:hypothetical protein GCM10020227_24390 [Streptomyces flavovirens]